jgi:hypothetical protein
MRGRSRGGAWVILCCALGAVLLLASCTGSPTTSANAIPSAGVGTPACSYQSSGVSGFVSSPGHAAGNQLVLGGISVQTSYLGMPVPVTGSEPWRFWQKRAVLIRAGTGPVLVSVPPSWRHRVAITYGTKGIAPSLVLTACRQPAGVWAAYAGGIYLRAVASCVPLVFTAGNRSVTIRFSVAGRCD